MLIALVTGCAKHGPPTGDSILLPLRRPVAWLPEPSDQAAGKAAAAALADKPKVLQEQVAQIRKIEDTHKGEDLEILSQDLVNATLDDPRDYRAASKKLKRGFGTDPSVQARLDIAVQNDPLALARRRRLDTLEMYWARTFNAVAKTAGQSVLTGFVLAPMQIATTASHFLASFSNDEALSLTDRQALTLHKEYLARHGDADNADSIRRKVETAERKLAITMQSRRMRSARAARDANHHRAAIIDSTRALAWGPHEEASELKREAEEKLARRHQLMGRSMEALNTDDFHHGDEWDEALATELLVTSARGETLSEETIAELRVRTQGDGPRRGEALYILAMTQKEAGFEEESWRTLGKLARQHHSDDPMSRHASHLLHDPWQNPYGAHKTMVSHRRNDKWRWRVLAGYSRGSRYPNLPRPVAYVLEGPGIATTVVTSPIRMVFGSFSQEPDFQRPAAVLGYRYLGLYPDGQHSREVITWLFDYEDARGNHSAALRLADFMPRFSPERRKELVEAASTQSLAAAGRARRADQRTQILRRTSTEYPETRAGIVAGKRVRAEFEEDSPQKIRMTRDFLKENRRVAGDSGLGLNPQLINGRLEDGELHPMGVSLLGGRSLRFELISRTGDEDALPRRVEKQVSQERMAQLASMLEETTRRNQLLDHDDTLEADA
ncbi:MAG: hypothetical protein VCC04_11680, partial [Myxococcota bacterium]